MISGGSPKAARRLFAGASTFVCWDGAAVGSGVGAGVGCGAEPSARGRLSGISTSAGKVPAPRARSPPLATVTSPAEAQGRSDEPLL